MKNRQIPFTTILLALTSLVVSPGVQAADLDGVLPGGNNAAGAGSLTSLTTGTYNTAVGWFSLKSNTTSQLNTALGAGALLANTGDQNTATGAGALLSNTTGFQNTANGTFALFGNTEGTSNTANGAFALENNITGTDNTAVGTGSLASNTEGGSNTAVGTDALFANTSSFNTAVGAGSLEDNTTGSSNTALGIITLQHNTTGAFNTANGYGALIFNSTGNNNTGLGVFALESDTANNNTACGAQTLRNASAGDYNIALGALAGINQTTGSNNIYIGDAGFAGENNVISIGATPSSGTAYTTTYIGGIYGVTTALSAVPVVIASDGQLGTVSSSRRFKKEIKPMDDTSEGILALKPVTFHYKSDTSSTPQFGLIAEEVAEVNPNLVVREKSGEIYTVRYDAVNAMLLNEFLKEHRKVEEQGTAIIELKKEVASLTTTIKKQDAKAQKVGAQVELNKPAREVVLNNP